jgi:hypothetical protein
MIIVTYIIFWIFWLAGERLNLDPEADRSNGGAKDSASTKQPSLRILAMPVARDVNFRV